MRTYEEIIAENPNAVFLMEDTPYALHATYSIIDELNDNWLDYLICDPLPKVYVGIPKLLRMEAGWVMDYIGDCLLEDAYDGYKFTYDDEDKKNLQACIDNIILKNKEDNTIYERGEPVCIRDLWDKLSQVKGFDDDD